MQQALDADEANLKEDALQLYTQAVDFAISVVSSYSPIFFTKHKLSNQNIQLTVTVDVLVLQTDQIMKASIKICEILYMFCDLSIAFDSLHQVLSEAFILGEMGPFSFLFFKQM